MWFSVLGRLEVTSDNGAGVDIAQPRQRALLTVLLLHANQEMSVSRLTESAWDQDVPAVSPGALRTQIWALRKLLAPARRLHTGRHHSYQMEVRPGELDAARFRQLAGQGRHAIESGDLPGAVSSLSDALALWREPALADVPANMAMRPVAQRLLDERAVVREQLTVTRLSLGQHVGLIPELRESTAAHPTNERLWELLMLAMHGAGRTAEALDAYQQARTAMQAELGLEPGQGLQELHHRILAGDPEPGQRRTAPAAGQYQEFTSRADRRSARAEADSLAAGPFRWRASRRGGTIGGMKTTIFALRTGGQDRVHDITAQCAAFARDAAQGGDGLLHVFVPHATAGIAIMELGSGSDSDLLSVLAELLPADDRWRHSHGTRGHGRSHVLPAFLPPFAVLPVVAGSLALGTWQSVSVVDINTDNPDRQVRLSFIDG